ncbi:MAG: HigA family addiction module antitoxin [Thiobacillaceae bacterium]
MTRMHNPPHPGAVLREWIPEGMSVTQAAIDLHVSRVSLSKMLNGNTGISADMAIRLSRWLGTSPDLWVGMQAQYDLWQAAKRKQPKIQPLLKRAA